MAETNSLLDNDRDGFSDNIHKERDVLPSDIDTGSLRASENENKFQSAISAWRREFQFGV